MIDLREIKDTETIKKHLSQEITIFAKYYGTKLVVHCDGDKTLTYFKNKNVPITIIDFIINDIYETPINIIKNIDHYLEADRTHYFTYDHTNDVLILDNPADNSKCDEFINNGSIFDGILSDDMVKMFTRKHTIKIMEHLDPQLSMQVMSYIIKKDDKNLFKIDNKQLRFPLYRLKYESKKLYEDIVNFIDIDDLSKLCIDEPNETHVYIKMINRIFLKFLEENENRDWATISDGIPDNFKPSDITTKYEYLEEDVKNAITANPHTYPLYSMLLSQFRKKKIFIGKDNKPINDKYKKIYKKMRDVCKNNIFSTSLPPLNEILK